MPATPKKGRRFGGSAAHQRLMMANLVASLVAAEGIVTTEAKAKALRPVAEKVITKAKKGGLHNHRQVVVVPRRQGDGRQALRRRSARATPTATAATRASSSSARATATTRRWPASSWSEPRSPSSAPRRRRRDRTADRRPRSRPLGAASGSTVAYDGPAFHGFAGQRRGCPPCGARWSARSRRVLRLERPVELTCAGRTDRGVHALGPGRELRRGRRHSTSDAARAPVNQLCGPDIAVREVDRRAGDFDARFSATVRTYRYTVLNRPVPDPFLRGTAWHVDDAARRGAR